MTLPGWACLLLPGAGLTLACVLGLVGEVLCPRARAGGGGMRVESDALRGEPARLTRAGDDPNGAASSAQKKYRHARVGRLAGWLWMLRTLGWRRTLWYWREGRRRGWMTYDESIAFLEEVRHQ